jgi:hypothetical protein
MANEDGTWVRQGEDFWRAHHEAWKRSDLNQREYCQFHSLPQKAFENWRQKFRGEPQPPQRKLLYRRRGLSPPFSQRLSPTLSPPLSPGAYLKDILERMSAGHPMSRIDELLPWNWRPSTALN